MTDIVTRAEIEWWKHDRDTRLSAELSVRLIASYERAMAELARLRRVEELNASTMLTVSFAAIDARNTTDALLAAYDGAGGEEKASG